MPGPHRGRASLPQQHPRCRENSGTGQPNRGIVMTPFHNMALMCPATSAADVDRHSEVFDAALAELVGD
jgi:glutamate-1-semialdehyde 2,1-aminomutase